MDSKIVVGYDGSRGARDALVLGGLLGELTRRPLLLAAFFDDDPVRYATDSPCSGSSTRRCWVSRFVAQQGGGP